jgi:recombinational DNA repair ATPase RecF
MLKKIVLNSFGAFESAALEFSRGVNVFVGANATGKTHVMKLAYSIMRTWRDFEEQQNSSPRKSNAVLADRLATKLTSVFRPDDGKLGRLVRRGRGRNKSTIELELDQATVALTLSTLARIDVKHFKLESPWMSKEWQCCASPRRLRPANTMSWW